MALTAKQKAFIDAYCENPVIPMAELARQMDIPVKTVYNWRTRNDNGFKDELDERLRVKWEEAKHWASEGMMSLAREGNYSALKYLLDYSGYAPTTKSEVKLDTTTINVKIGDD